MGVFPNLPVYTLTHLVYPTERVDTYKGIMTNMVYLI